MAQNDSEKYILNEIVQNGHRIMQGNTPEQYGDRQHQFFAESTRQFIAERAKYATDFVQAEVQGIFADDFYRYVTTNIRFADVASQSATSTKKVDDVKVVLFQEPKIDYFPIGAKIQTMGNTWICTNPSNMSGVHATALVQRCNVAYNLYDYYGNIVSEPIVVDKPAMLGNDNTNSQNLVLMDGYFKVICQKNEYTDLLGQNQRIILGSKPYHITGFTDFIQEYTGDYDSVHLYQFDIRIEEPQENDDMDNRIANGKEYTFGAEITGVNEVKEGDVSQLFAHFVKNGKTVDSTADKPIAWEWSSSNAEIATVTDDGIVSGISMGVAQITATMRQNSQISATYELNVVSAQVVPMVQFIGVVPTEITQYRTAEIQAGYYENGALTLQAVTWTFGGVSDKCYKVSYPSKNTISIMCLRESDTPLTVTASYGDVSTTVEIKLETY